MFIVVSYDISDDKKRKKVAELLKDYGIRVQYSVFECNIDQKYLKQMINEILPYIDEKQDSLRIYYICEGCRERVETYGCKILLDEEGYIVV
ncbi:MULTISPECIES: CRISPR-associated endonuclease Cas2 [Thermodesulfovibrio]|uniref:CRISPR-associated endoribonuclease Cas2 n=1 Tax=Thermodesulfovibrio yellowstonii TaxID=28262 RepID=A0A9W6LIW8_9BACT|nr:MULTISPECIES: CRISPR-associated endonuclease Cas2 [Thermodesulfovibrio]GLI52591.1 CRISPR-associated endoribonuclease Cas2 3 [Thermodesulfovibrio islandicus]